jgi:hypothetical protein
MINKFDIFIPCAPKDFNKLPYVAKSVIDNIRGGGEPQLHICTPIQIPCEILKKIPGILHLYYDQDLLPGIDRNICNYRPNWHFQQFIKLFQKVTSDWYLTWDCDTIACRPIEFFENGRPVYYLGWDQFNKPYFTFQKEMIGIGRVSPVTFIADMNLIHRPIINEMLDRSGHTIQSFVEKSNKIITSECYMAEPELYGSYVWDNHPDLYVYKRLKQRGFEGRIHDNVNGFVWQDGEIEEMIEECKDKGFDTFSLHSWFIEKGI